MGNAQGGGVLFKKIKNWLYMLWFKLQPERKQHKILGKALGIDLDTRDD
jgi:hypothetical protein